VGKDKLARETGLSVSDAKKLIEAYWKRNWAVKQLSEDTITKKVNGELWLFNPVSRFWYSLRNEKDIFSTLNQGTGVYCFDTWIRVVRKKRSQLTAQFHDETILSIKKGSEEKCEQLLKDSIQEVNNLLKLNVNLDVDVQFGHTYAEIH
jgi:DNA polymerase I-like protein with 3'-5' exonuclease and polymerase domains